MNVNALPQCAPADTCFFVRNGSTHSLRTNGFIQCETRFLVTMLNWLSLISPVFFERFAVTVSEEKPLSNVQTVARTGFANYGSIAEPCGRNPSTNNPDGFWTARQSDIRPLPCAS